jgi:phosphoribosylformimino-5-aminoimidazole carboxamide ribonucleotide (ProFAR) isomerase
MAFEVIPAVDVAGGRLARLSASGPVPVEAFGGAPLVAAAAFVEAGAVRIHLVDMDRALGVTPKEDVVGPVAALGVPVQASGGLIDRGDVDEMLDRGADRAVLSARALSDRPALEATLSAGPEVVVVGLEVEGGRIRPRGGEGLDLSLEETLSWLAGAGAARFLLTDLARLREPAGGPDLDLARGVAEILRRPLLVAGGIAGAPDIRAVQGLGPPVEGVVVGRALYEATTDLRELLAAGGSTEV